MTEDAVKQPDSSLIYTYDNNSNRTSLIYGLGLALDLYKVFGTFYTYDEENQLTSLSSAGGNFNFEYDDLSRMTKMSYPNGMETRMSYEGDMRLSKIEHIKTGLFDRVQSQFSYLYDNNDNKTRMQTFRKTLPINETLNYTYDKKNQLLTATNPLRSVANETFTYDLAGNLLRKQGQSQDSNYNENNQLTDDGTYTYKYDTKGNMIERIQKDNNKTTRYEWDIENQLIKVTTHETENAMPSETITYAYDGLGRRIEKNINGKIKRYIYDNEDILMEFDGDNLLQQHYIHGLGIDEPIAMIKNDFRNGSDNAKTYYYHKDGMGSITSLTDKDGKEIEKYIYNAFGKMTIYDEEDNKLEESQFDNPYSFTGREHDSETGLHYHRARYYNPELARWISEDPIEFNSGDMNLYRYVENNPLSWVDPDGLIVFGVIAGGAVGLGLGPSQPGGFGTAGSGLFVGSKKCGGYGGGAFSAMATGEAIGAFAGLSGGIFFGFGDVEDVGGGFYTSGISVKNLTLELAFNSQTRNIAGFGIGFGRGIGKGGFFVGKGNALSTAPEECICKEK